MLRPRKASAEKSKMSAETMTLVEKAKDALFSSMPADEANIIIDAANDACEKDGVAKGFWVTRK